MSEEISDYLLIDGFTITLGHYVNSKKYICVTHINHQYIDEWVKRKWVSYKKKDDLFLRQVRILKLGKAILEFDKL